MKLIQDIDNAFELVKKPPDNVIVRIPDDLDSIEAQKIFSGRTSSEISKIGDLTALGITSAEDLYHMTDYAVHYYLPCYLKYLIDERKFWEFSIVTGIIDFLDTNSGKKRGAEYPDFSASQKEAIAKVLGYVLEHLSQYDLNPYAKDYEEKLRILLCMP